MLRQFIFKAYLSGSKLMGQILLGLLAIYRYAISPWLGNRCRFYPSCSVYAQEAILKLGVIKGLLRIIWRLLRCHPWHPGGYDPVLNKRVSS